MTLTKKWLLKTIAELEEERDAVPGAVNEDAANALAAMKLALASLEAEPVFEVEVSGNHWLNAGPVDDSDFSGMPDGVNQLYSAPPAPASVPEKITSANAPEVFEIAAEAERLGLRGAYASYAVGWNACRAAMLQVAEQTKYRAIVERIAEIIHGKVTDIDLLTVTVKSMKDKLQK
ncbi:hypothetical protein [Enterobacter hormaechei]|uniref:hypothetical protein n=1 Tax=Enterobacter hormaechei TaxID=158836 RepID=UPI00254D6553|nr:hypothetical protein [Enterobacter hormaechei]MDL0041730.1 hypothetical protein [Enterobacter hormaechei]